MSELKPCELCRGDYHTFYDGVGFKVNCQNKHCKLYLVAMTKEQWQTRTQSQCEQVHLQPVDMSQAKRFIAQLTHQVGQQKEWISNELSTAINKCFKCKIGCGGMLMVAVDDYNELVDLINKATLTKIGE